MNSIQEYIEFVKHRQAQTDISNVVGLRKAKEVRKEMSKFIENNFK